MRTDLRLALRALLRRPGFAAVTVLTLALGVGATSTVFALVHAALLERLPYREPDRLLLVAGEMRREGVQEYPLSYLDGRALAGEGALFSDVAAVTGTRSFNLAAGERTDHVNGEMSDAPLFALLGVPMALGRSYTAEEARAPGARVVVLSHHLWASRFGASRAALGASLTLNEQPYTIIGVAAPGFRGLTDEAELWLPIGLAGGMYGPHYLEMREYRWLSVAARLAPGVSVDRGLAGLRALSTRLERAYPKENGQFSYTAETLADALASGLRRPLWLLLAGASFVLLIGCANVANLALVRANARRREMAARAALGARAGQLARPLVAEALVLCAAGTALGLAAAAVAAPLVAASGLVELASFVRVRVGWRVALATAAGALLCRAAFGLLPALAAARVRPREDLVEGTARSGVSRARAAFQRALVGAEVAVSLVLLVGAALMARGFSRFVASDLGFAAEGLLTLRVDLTADRYKANETAWAFLRALHDGASGVPGVAAAAIEGPSLPTGGWYQIHFRRDGGDGRSFAARRHHVTPGYLQTLGIRLREGRDLDASDVAGPVRSVVISRRYAERLFPGARAVGGRLVADGANPVPALVVGVVEEVEHGGLRADDRESVDVYLSAYQSPPRSPALATLYVRTAPGASPAAVEPALRDVLRALDPSLAFYDVRPMRDRLRAQTTTGRFLVALMAGFGVVGLLLAATGVYGVVSYGVGQRTREIGVRMALGADGRQVVSGVVGQGMRPVLAGIAVGLGGVWALHRFVTALLYGMSPADPPTLVGAVAVLAAAALAASVVPAARAARIDPVRALRAD